MKLIHLQGNNSNVGFAERLGPGLQNQLEWSNSTTRLQMPLWCNGLACQNTDLPVRVRILVGVQKYGSDGREV